LRRFWSSLGSRPDPTAVTAEWREWIGSELDLVLPYLSPMRELATAYPCPRPGGDGCPRRVVKRPAPDNTETFVAVCGCSPRECEEVELAKGDLILRRPDVPKIVKELRSALGVTGQPGPLEDLPNAWRVGMFIPDPRLRVPVLFIWRAERDALAVALADLLGRQAGPALVLVPSAEDLPPVARAELARRGAAVVDLGTTVGYDAEARRLAMVLTTARLRALLPARSAHVADAVALVITDCEEREASADDVAALLGADRDAYDLIVDGIRNQIWKRGAAAPGKFRAKNHVHVLRDLVDAHRPVLPDDLLSVRHVSADGGGRAEQLIRTRHAIEGARGRRFIKSTRLDDDLTAYQWAPDPGLRFALIFALDPDA